MRRGQAAASSPRSADPAWASFPARASPEKVKRPAEPPERGRIKRVASGRVLTRRHIPSGPDAAGARCFQLPLEKSGPLRRGRFFHGRTERRLQPGLNQAAVFRGRSEAGTPSSDLLRRVNCMAKPAVQFACTECGYSAGRWFGKCPGCNAFGTLVEEVIGQLSTASAPPKPLLRLVDVQVEEAARISTGVPELDRVLGGGLVPASLVLLGGEPGVGKSTLLLSALAAISRDRRT